MKIADMIPASCILPSINARDKVSALEEIVATLTANKFIAANDETQIIKKLLDREHLASTGTGQGTAFPCCRWTKDCFVFARSGSGIDWDSLGDMPVKIIFLELCLNDAVCLEFKSNVLGRIIKRPEIITALQTAADANEIIRVIRSADEQMFNGL